MTSRNICRRLERIEALLLRVSAAPLEFTPVFIHASDGKPSGLESVFGPDGRQVWSVPPKGCKVGDFVEN